MHRRAYEIPTYGNAPRTSRRLKPPITVVCLTVLTATQTCLVHANSSLHILNRWVHCLADLRDIRQAYTMSGYVKQWLQALAQHPVPQTYQSFAPCDEQLGGALLTSTHVRRLGYNEVAKRNIPDLYLERQLKRFCHVHAMNAFFGRSIVTPSEML